MDPVPEPCPLCGGLVFIVRGRNGATLLVLEVTTHREGMYHPARGILPVVDGTGHRKHQCTEPDGQARLL